jgi:hypothetical protein
LPFVYGLNIMIMTVNGSVVTTGWLVLLRAEDVTPKSGIHLLIHY